ncbi:SEC12-like protein 2 [Phoenix dactylifera]|uniref:SEC12-like protein 2 n=1 Tax=Phoenix dactylifera TaxID=42345 RepID=A0A8B9AIE8_PHODC|nr:SEC12-like protein 2 [Phoenix dactylifera]
MAEWLEKNVREEEYVVMKAEAGVVEEVVNGRAIGLVDELFLECDHQWEKKKKKKKGSKETRSRRAYWECLALYGKLRTKGWPSTSGLTDWCFRMGTDAEVPYRMAVHPGETGFFAHFQRVAVVSSFRWTVFEWDFPERKESHKLALKSSEKKLSQLVEDGLQLAVAFNARRFNASTGGRGVPTCRLAVYDLRQFNVLMTLGYRMLVKEGFAFQSRWKVSVSLGNSGPCRVWDLISSTAVAHLPREDGEVFGFCRFSQSTDNSQILLITAMHGDQGKIVSWNTLSWKRLGSKKVVRDPISAFHVATDGKLFAIGTVEGNIMILNSDMQVQTIVKKAHLGIVTALTFSQDSRALMSASFDSSARVTLIESRKSSGLSMLLVVLVIILAILVYFMKLKGVL